MKNIKVKTKQGRHEWWAEVNIPQGGGVSIGFFEQGDTKESATEILRRRLERDLPAKTFKSITWDK